MNRWREAWKVFWEGYAAIHNPAIKTEDIFDAMDNWYKENPGGETKVKIIGVVIILMLVVAICCLMYQFYLLAKWRI